MVRRGVARVLIVDDHRTFSELLSMALHAEPDFECVGVADSAAAAVEAAARLRPDVVVMDIEMPRRDGLSAARQIREMLPGTAIAVVSAHGGPEWVTRAVRAGANGYVTKDGSLPEMLDVLRRVRVGSMVTGRSVLIQLGQLTDGEQPPALTEREREVLAWMCRGMAPKAIARALGISLHTCRGYVKSLYAKLGVGSQLQAVAKAQRLGLVASREAE